MSTRVRPSTTPGTVSGWSKICIGAPRHSALFFSQWSWCPPFLRNQKNRADRGSYCKAIFKGVGAAFACVKSRQNGKPAGNALRYDIFVFNPNLSQISLKMNKNSRYGGLHHRVGRLECSRLVKHVAEPSKFCRVLILSEASVCPNLRGNTYVFS